MNRLISIVLILLINQLGQSQQLDLSTLAAGEFLGLYSLDEWDGDLFGYVTTYRKDRLNESEDQFEVVVMDKNLNILSQLEFVAESEVDGYRPYFNIKGELILYPQASTEDMSKKEKKKFVYPASRVVNLKLNSVHLYGHICLANDKLITCPENLTREEYKKRNKKDVKKRGYIDDYSLYLAEDSTYTAMAWNRHQDRKGTFEYISGEHVIKFDKNKQVLWKRNFHDKAKKFNYTFSKLLYADESKIYFFSYVFIESRLKRVHLIGLDAKNGEEVFSENLSKKFDLFNSTFGLPFSVRSFDEAVVIHGTHESTSIRERVMGYYQIKIDKESDHVRISEFTNKDLKQKMGKIDRYGNVGKGYFLSLRSIFPFEDGHSLILTEKLKTHGAWTGPTLKSKDFVLIVTDENFKVKSTKVIEKDKSKNSFTDLIFTQYLNDKRDYVFFYKDYRKDGETKEKNWILGIVTIIDGDVKIEEIPMSSDDFSIHPYVAKEGYVMLHEYNKKSKYNQVRLERLNF